MGEMQLFQGIDTEALLDSLVIMGKGMANILGVLILIALIVLVLTKVTNRKSGADEEEKSE